MIRPKKGMKKATLSTDEIMKEITLLAYQYFEQKGYQHGEDLDDWLRAEKEIKKKHKIR